MTDIWNDKGFEFYSDDDNGYINFEILKNGSLEVALCDGRLRENYRDGRMEMRQDEITLSPERTIEFLAGLQAWLEGLK